MSATVLLTSVALVSFAANSLLARLALADGAMDAAGFTGVRLASGALVLAVLLLFRWRATDHGTGGGKLPGNWISGSALFVYAIAFSLAYLRLGAATGALVLFTTVQMTMLGWGYVRGERPGPVQAAGIAIAIAGFVALVSPGLVAPDPLGTALMIVSGMAWGVYSLRGRSTTDPAGDTAGNFIRTVPLAAVLTLAAIAAGSITVTGLWLSLASGILASAGGYIVWYRVLPHLAAMQAAILQLTVPVIATAGAVVFIGEPLTPGFVLAGAVILGGVWLALVSKSRGA